MKIFISHSSDYDYKKELYEKIINSDLYDNYDFIFPMLNDYENIKDIPSKDVIWTCDLLIADISRISFWVWIELGWADIQKVPILYIYKKWTEFSKSLNILSNDFIEYEDSSDMIYKIWEYLKKYDKN